MKRTKRKGLIEGAAILSLAILSTVTSGLAKVNNQCSDPIHLVHHHEKHRHEYGAVVEQLPISELSEPAASSLGIKDLFPGSGNGNEEQFVSEQILRLLPYESLYHGENMSSYCEQPIFVKDYFRNLTEEFPTNDEERNCGYVDLSMLLSYYDTYWNSSIIDDKYQTPGRKHLDSLSDQDFVSPGIKDLNLPVWNAPWYEDSEPEPLGDNPSEAQKQKYYKTINTAFSRYLEQMTRSTNVDQYLLSYLYTMGIEAGVLNFHDHPVPTTDLEGIQKIAACYFRHTETFYKEPIDESLLGLDYSFHKSSKYSYLPTEQEKLTAVRNEIIERLKCGQPLIVGGVLKNGEGGEGEGHIAIAYEYDEQNDVIYGHSGSKDAGGSRVNMDALYCYIDSYAWLKVDNEVRYSQPKSQSNPRFEVDGAAHDTCDLYSHVHGFINRFDYGNPGMHAIQCPCGETKYAYHVFIKDKKGPGKRCRLCWHREIDSNWRPGINVF